MLRALAALGDWPLTHVFACGFRILRNPTLRQIPFRIGTPHRILLTLLRSCSASAYLHFRFTHELLMSFPSEQPLDRFADKSWEHHPEKEQKTQEKAETHQRQKSIRIDKELVDEKAEKPDQRENQNDSNHMRQQENQRLEQERDFALWGAQFLTSALRTDVCGARIDVAAGAKSDVVSLAAVVAVRGSAGCRPSAAKTKLHRLLSKNGSF